MIIGIGSDGKRNRIIFTYDQNVSVLGIKVSAISENYG